MDLRNEWHGVCCQECLDPRHRRNEALRQLFVRCLTDEDEQTNSVLFDGRQLVGLVANATIVRDGRPLLSANALEPFFVGCSRREVINMPLDVQAGRTKDIWKLVAEIAIGEEDAAQAARS